MVSVITLMSVCPVPKKSNIFDLFSSINKKKLYYFDPCEKCVNIEYHIISTNAQDIRFHLNFFTDKRIPEYEMAMEIFTSHRQ
jgi:hypothetical protein